MSADGTRLLEVSSNQVGTVVDAATGTELGRPRTQLITAYRLKADGSARAVVPDGGTRTVS